MLTCTFQRWKFLELAADQLSSGSAQAQALKFLDFAAAGPILIRLTNHHWLVQIFRSDAPLFLIVAKLYHIGKKNKNSFEKLRFFSIILHRLNLAPEGPFPAEKWHPTGPL